MFVDTLDAVLLPGCFLYFVAVTENGSLEETWIAKYFSNIEPENIHHSDAYHYLLGLYWAIATVSIINLSTMA